MTSPILFLMFNRPDLASRVFDTIRRAQPGLLFLAVDGPRASRPGDVEACEACRLLASKVDWPCEVKTLFRETNLGCKEAVSSAISWFFEHVEQGIILEDDCLPDPSFFGFCELMLQYYKEDPRVGIVSGNNFRPASLRNFQGYYFSIYSHIWGWASWRRTWQQYDKCMPDWKSLSSSRMFDALGLDRWQRRYWSKIFDCVHAGEIDTWDYQLLFTCWKERMLTVIPGVNLVTNIGFDHRATRTKVDGFDLGGLESLSIELPMKRLEAAQVDSIADKWVSRNVFHIVPSIKTDWKSGVKWVKKRLVPLLKAVRRILKSLNIGC